MTGPKHDAWLIGPAEAAQRLGISIKALKFYERLGIVSPKRTLRGWRLYAPTDMDRISRALAFKKMGFAPALAAHETELNFRRADLDEAFAALREARRRLAPVLALVA